MAERPEGAFPMTLKKKPARGRAAKKILTQTFVASAVLAASASVAFADANPGANPVQAKYMTRSGVAGSMCAPQGTLKDLVSGKYGCSGLKGGDACNASL